MPKESGDDKIRAVADKQRSLFGDKQPEQSSSSLILTGRKDRPLTKAQQVFNRRLTKIDSLRKKLDRETRQLDCALAYYVEHLNPRETRLVELRKDVVRGLMPFLQDKRLKRKTERDVLRKVIADQLQMIVESDVHVDDEIRALFEQVHGMPVEQAGKMAERDFLSATQDLFDQMGLRIDLSELADLDDETLAARMQEMESDILMQSDEEESASRAPRARKSSRRAEKEKLREQAEELRSRTLSSMYKQLARVLHPDLEQDPALKERKVAFMQQLTVAYRENDLHTLLRIELEWIHHEETDLDRLTDQKLEIYNEVLKEQAQDLEMEIEQLQFHPRYMPVTTDDPFMDYSRYGPLERRELDHLIASIEKTNARLNSEFAFDEVRDLVQALKPVRRRRGDGN